MKISNGRPTETMEFHKTFPARLKAWMAQNQVYEEIIEKSLRCGRNCVHESEMTRYPFEEYETLLDGNKIVVYKEENFMSYDVYVSLDQLDWVYKQNWITWYDAFACDLERVRQANHGVEIVVSCERIPLQEMIARLEKWDTEKVRILPLRAPVKNRKADARHNRIWFSWENPRRV